MIFDMPNCSQNHKGTVYAKLINTENRFILNYNFLKIVYMYEEGVLLSLFSATFKCLIINSVSLCSLLHILVLQDSEKQTLHIDSAIIS